MTIREAVDDGVIRLRRYRDDDVDAIYEAARESIAEIAPWMPWCHADYSREEAEQWVDAQPEAWGRGDHALVIEEVGTSRVLGSTGINKIDPAHRNGNLGYWVRTSEAGRGVATRATILVARWAFTDLELIRVEIVAAVDNRASRRVAEKVGAIFEGVRRHGLSLHRAGVDAAVYSLIRSDLGFSPLRGVDPGRHPG